MRHFATPLMLAALFFTLACSNQSNVSYKDAVEKALQQADLKDVTVAEDGDKNTITLGGILHSQEAKAKAAAVATSAADTRIIANEISLSALNRKPKIRQPHWMTVLRATTRPR
jgi:hypothetical protein